MPALEKRFSLTDVYGADEAFVTGTFAGLVPVRSVDGRSDRRRGRPTRPVTERLSAALQGAREALADADRRGARHDDRTARQSALRGGPSAGAMSYDLPGRLARRR